jgi:hypothetical protein
MSDEFDGTEDYEEAARMERRRTTLTWREAIDTLQSGARVRFVQDWDVFPLTVVKEGTTGKVVFIENNSQKRPMSDYIHVLPDDEAIRATFAEWDGVVYLEGPDGENPDGWNEPCAVQVQP